VQTELRRWSRASLPDWLGTITEKGPHRRLLDELLGVLEEVPDNDEGLEAAEEKVVRK